MEKIGYPFYYLRIRVNAGYCCYSQYLLSLFNISEHSYKQNQHASLKKNVTHTHISIPGYMMHTFITHMHLSYSSPTPVDPTCIIHRHTHTPYTHTC